MVVSAFKIPTKGKPLHPPEKIRVIGEHVFKRAMAVARFAHKDAPAFLQYFRINHSWLLSKIGNLIFTLPNCFYCFAVAIRTQRGRSPGDTQFHGSSLSPLEQRSWGPLWCGQDSLSKYAVNRLKKFPGYICDGTEGVSF